MSKYGLQVVGKVRVFRKDKEIQGKGKKTFNVTDIWFNVSEREEDGSYFNKSMNLIFGRDADRPENNTVIEIFESFPMITGDGQYRRISLFVKSWEYAQEESQKGK